CRPQRVEDVVDHRAAAHLEQRLRRVERERVEAGRVARGEHDRLQSAYGGRLTPSSVTIAAISSAGVTSKAGFRAGKRAVISAPSRSSIGMAAPVGVAGSTVEVGATT